MGHHIRHFAGDTYTHKGIWGAPTSAANFCEEDYGTTRFVGEFINSLSNLAYVYFAFKYPGHAVNGSWVLRRLDSLAAALLLVGVTSTAFHVTLRQTAQFTDDLSMLLLAGVLMQKLFSNGQSPGLGWLLTVSIWLPTVAISLIYVRSSDIIIHMYTFVTMVALIGSRLLYLIYGQHRPKKEIKDLVSRFWKGAAYLAVAFVVWNIDLEACLQLRELRQRVGLPWAWFLELHGWWHILTAIGAARFIGLVRLLCDQHSNTRQQRGGSEQPKRPGKTDHMGHSIQWRMFCVLMSEESKADLDRIGDSR